MRVGRCLWARVEVGTDGKAMYLCRRPASMVSSVRRLVVSLPSVDVRPDAAWAVLAMNRHYTAYPGRLCPRRLPHEQSMRHHSIILEGTCLHFQAGPYPATH